MVGLGYVGLRVTRINLFPWHHINEQLSWMERMGTALGSLWTYLRLLIAPVHLHMLYQTEPIHTWLHPRVVGAGLLIVGSVWWIVRARRHAPIRAFYASWILVGLLPVLNLVPLNAFVAEHWWYFPSMGAMALISLAFSRGLQQVSRFLGILLKGGLLMGVAILGILTFRQNAVWSHPVTFLSYTLTYAPRRPLLYVQLGDALRSQGHTTQALEAYQRALALNPTYYVALARMGSYYLDQQDYREAQRWYEQALRVTQGAQAPTLQNDLGVIYLKEGRVEEAVAQFQRALALHPYRVECWANLGRAYVRLQQPDKAIEMFHHALALDPAHVGSYKHLGDLYIVQGDYQQAISHYLRALALDHDPRLYLNLGMCYLKTGKYELARTSWEEALKLKPDYQEAMTNLRLLDGNSGTR